MFTIPILFGLVVSKPVFIGMAAATAGLGGYLLVRGDSRVEARREASIRLGRLASEEGFPHVAPILDAYAVGDYSGMIGSLKAFAAMMLDPATRRQAFTSMLKVQIGLHLTDKAKLEAFQNAVSEHGYTLVKAEAPAKAA